MKIVQTDNFGRENVEEILIAENVTEYYGVKIVKLLNAHVGSQSSVFYKLENNKYVLWRGMEEFNDLRRRADWNRKENNTTTQ